MTYRKLLELYKNKELDENGRARVEADIERQEAISDYLYEKSELPALEASLEKEFFSEEDTALMQEREFTRVVNRSIRNAFLKMGTVIFALVLVVVLFIQFAMPGIVSAFYYNPGKETVKNQNQMSLDLAVYSELAIPGYYRDAVSVEDNGYGDYDINIYQNASSNGIFTNLSGKIKKGKLTLYDMNLLKRPAGNAFAWFQMEGTSSDSLKKLESEGRTMFGAGGSRTDAKENLQNLAENVKYISYVTLDKMMKYEDFMEFLGEQKDLNVWCAVRTNGSDTLENSRMYPDNLGFRCTLSSSTSLDWDREAYPNLLLWDDITTGADGTGDLSQNMQNETFMKTHFTSMLRYLSEQNQFLAMMEEEPEDFLAAADYVDENGLLVYGFAVIADKNTLLELEGMEEIYTIYTQPLR